MKNKGNIFNNKNLVTVFLALASLRNRLNVALKKINNLAINFFRAHALLRQLVDQMIARGKINCGDCFWLNNKKSKLVNEFLRCSLPSGYTACSIRCAPKNCLHRFDKLLNNQL